ncbi:MAG TPA: hypothetical protein PKU97_24100 [Kofleriaceae bacterium]|nr:hypothetical protein [Kofleriaceae bacterium]
MPRRILGQYDHLPERKQLPDREPWHAWTNFEFIDEEGKVASGRMTYRKMFSGLEKAVVAYQSRRGG